MVKIEKITNSSHSTLLFAEIMNLEQAAWDSNFYIRQPNKITATALFSSFFETHQSGKNTLKNWSANMSLLIGKSVSEQSIDERLNERAVTLAKEVLKDILDAKTPKNIIEDKKKLVLILYIFSIGYSFETVRHKNYRLIFMRTSLVVIPTVNRRQLHVCNHCSTLQTPNG